MNQYKKLQEEIVDDSIVTSVCGIKSNITLSEICDVFNLEIDMVIESLEDM